MPLLAAIDPIAFELGPLTVRWYGLTFVAAVLTAFLCAERAARRRGLDSEFMYDVTMVVVPSGILGARLYEVFVLQWGYFSQHPGEILRIWEGGLAIHGGVLGALLLGGLFVRYRKQPFWLWADMIAPGLVLAQAVGRWGNFFNQEAYGSPAPTWLVGLMPGWLREGMTIGGEVMHPTFLYESVANVIAFLLLYAYQRRNPAPGSVIGLYFVLYNIGRFLIGSVRTDTTFILGFLRVAQLMAVAQIVAGVLIILWANRRQNSAA